MGETDWTQESKSTLHTHFNRWKEDKTPTPRLKFNAVKLGVLEKTENFHVSSCYEFMFFLSCKHTYMKHILKHIVTFRPYDVSKWRSENLLIEHLTWDIKWHLWGQHQEMCLQCCVDQKRRLLGKGTHEILRRDSEFALKMFKFETP